MRPIDADALKYTQAYAPCGNGKYEAVNIVYETDIDAAPTIEPKRGRWIYKPTEPLGYECSVCGKGCCRFNFCPNCGAKMERSESDG